MSAVNQEDFSHHWDSNMTVVQLNNPDKENVDASTISESHIIDKKESVEEIPKRLENFRKSGSNDSKGTKRHFDKELESLSHSQTVIESDSKFQDQRPKSRSISRKPHPDSTLINSGAENLAFESSEMMDSCVRKLNDSAAWSESQISENRNSAGVSTSETKKEKEDGVHQRLSSAHPAPRRNSASHFNYTASFIYNNIKQRECNVYAIDKQSKSKICQCGREAEWHHGKQEKTVEWCTKDHSRVMPCDSFGEIQFRGFGSQTHNSPYMRVDSECTMEKVWEVLTDCWQLPQPRLLISVTGGAKRFYLRPRLKNILKQGLVNAAVSTGAWILTGGTATGVMELVGEAVQDHIQSSGNPEDNECVALGITPWGVVANSHALDGEGEKGLFPAVYSMEDLHSEKKNRVQLDHNHTHFLLVDNGTEGKFGVEIPFRSRLESYISKEVETGVTQCQSVNVPSVLIVVEGGINTMKTVKGSLLHNIPVVVIDGSGRAADFIAFAFRLTKDRNDEDKTFYPSDFNERMSRKAEVVFEWRKDMRRNVMEQNISDSVQCLQDCLKHRKLINIFNLDKADSVKDIDRAILYALLKANKSSVNSQLALALAWNRCDIARQEIFTPENRHSWQQTELYNAMFTALVQNRADFVQLFMDNGVDLKRFLTIHTLWNLYCNCLKDRTSAEASFLKYLISDVKQTWTAYLLCQRTPDFENSPDLLLYISKVIVHLLKDQRFCFYTDSKYVVAGNEKPSMQWCGSSSNTSPQNTALENGRIRWKRRKQKFSEPEDFKHPERELFIWAILFNRRDLVHFFWRNGHDHLGSALFAKAVLSRLSEKASAEEEAELSRDMALHADECERWAVNVLSECYSRDKALTHLLLVRELQHWGCVTLLRMVEAFKLMEFAEHSACQTKLTSIWKGCLAPHTSEIMIALCTVLPILVPFFKFTTDLLDRKEEEKEQISTSDEDSSSRPKNGTAVTELPDSNRNGLHILKSNIRRQPRILATKFKKVILCGSATGNISIIYAILYFYQAPITKFFCNILSYLVFTGLFSYMVLVKLAPANDQNSPSLEEYFIWGWLATMVVEELRQFFTHDQHSLQYKFQKWFSSHWNRFDAVMYLLFFLTIILRYELKEEQFAGARVVYSITLVMFFLRFMQFFYFQKNTGPKVIMIRKMLTDLMFFFLILVVFVVSFGVAYHANMFPQSPASWNILANILYFPYFQIHGELFLDSMKGDDIDGCTHNETVWLVDPSERCPSKNVFVVLLLAVYMMLTNILLVNLLIAMFSYTFQTVQENSTRLWQYYRLSLISEYFDRPTLVPPIIIINHIFRLIRWVIHKTTGKGQRTNSFHHTLLPDEQDRLTGFERNAMEQQLSVSNQLSMLTLDSRVQNTASRLDTVMEELQMIKESMQLQEQMRSSGAVPEQYGLGSVMELNNLEREKELMERSSESRLRSDSQVQVQDIQNLHKAVDGVVAESYSMSERLNRLTLLLESFIREQQTSAHRRNRRKSKRSALTPVEETPANDSTET